MLISQKITTTTLSSDGLSSYEELQEIDTEYEGINEVLGRETRVTVKTTNPEGMEKNRDN